MRKKGSFGLLDAFIVTVILLSAVGLILRIQVLRLDVREDVSCEVRMVAKSLPREIADCIGVGDVLYTADGGVYGEVEEIVISPARVEWVSNGVSHTGEWEAGERINLSVRVRVSGSIADGVFLREGKYAILVGDAETLYSDLTSLEWLICQAEVS